MLATRGRMPGRASQSWCPVCCGPPGRDCPDIAKTPRQVRRRLQRELDQEIREVSWTSSTFRGEPAG